ncbi:prepilin-type N-terminal cleavage/methylation domain-containing protein [Candidatus Falkowbacteria bacterium]|nr:prepilin-type N-terminal cleavage/methylation domain-containing protein [Candidatus Falkowbacteria bacterium]
MRGFTLLELLIVIAILSIIGALSIPFIQIFQTSTDLYTHAYSISKTLQRAQQQALAGKNSSSWGVFFDDPSKRLIMFSGENFASRDQTYDLAINYPPSFVLSTDFGDEVYFAVYSGLPSVGGTITVANSNNQSQTVSVGDFGLIQIEL